jgi:arylsulfatase A-like enzyme
LLGYPPAGMAAAQRSIGKKWRERLAALGVMLLAAHLGCGAGDPESPGPATQSPGPRNVVLISIDSVRADRLGAYGHRRSTSPALDGLAEGGVVFEHAISQAPWTLPSMASMLTGLHPSQHGAVHASTELNEARETLPEALRAHGYFTVGVVSHIFVGSRYGFHRGFDVFDETQIKGHDAVTSQDLTRRALFHLEEGPKAQPFFLWVHYFDPHFTYVRHPDFGFADSYTGSLPEHLSAPALDRTLQERQQAGEPFSESDLAYVKAVYDEEIAYTDLWIGRLLTGLEGLAVEGSTLVIVTSDHGEYFLERGRFFHGKDVYEPLVHVPLLIGGAVPPSLQGRRVRQSVEVASIPKTVMGWIEADASRFPGRDLLALAGEKEPHPPAPVFAEGSYARGEDYRKRAVILGGWKLIHNFDDDGYELYDLQADPAEENDLWEQEEERPAAARAALLPHLEGLATGSRAEGSRIELSPEEIQHLESLGYVW